MDSSTRNMILAALLKAPAGKEWKQYVGGEKLADGQLIGLSHDGSGVSYNQNIMGLKGMRACELAKSLTAWHLVDVAPARYFTSATKFWDDTAYIRYVGDKGTIVNTDGTDWPRSYTVTLAEAIRYAKSGDWKEITAKEALALTKPAKSETELLRAEVAALKAEVADLKEKRELDRKDREALEGKLAAARAAVETLKNI